jgi:hypothetical protein
MISAGVNTGSHLLRVKTFAGAGDTNSLNAALHRHRDPLPSRGRERADDL